MMIETQSERCASPTVAAPHHSGEEMSVDITYTFAGDCPIRPLAGKTVSGGKFQEMNLAGKTEVVVKFSTIVDGKAVVARIAGKPELEERYAQHLADKSSRASTLTAIGWDMYSKAQSAAINARASYDAASEFGYPAREAEAMRSAEYALDKLATAYPGSASYALAEAYSYSAHYRKAAAGRTAMDRIERGEDPIAAVNAMRQEWDQAVLEAAARD